MNNDKAIKYSNQIPGELTIKYPKWLHSDICDAVQKFIGTIIYYKNAPLGIEIGIYSALTNRFNRIKPALTKPQMEDIWNYLYKENSESTLRVVSCLLQIENDFDHALSLRAKHVNEIKSSQKVTRLTQHLIDAMDENCGYYGHMQLCGCFFWFWSHDEGK